MATTTCSPTAMFGAPMLVMGGVNTIDDEFSPRLSADERTLYFARRLAGNFTGPMHVYMATRPTATSIFDAGIALLINSTASDADPMIGTDDRTLLFSSDRITGSGEFDLYWADRASAGVAFISASPVPDVNSAGSEVHPFFASDGELWFAYRKAGFDSALHLRRSVRAGVGFGPPVPVAELDSAGDDMWPVLTSDKRTIYFSSSQIDGSAQGKADVWVARRSSATAVFDLPVNVTEVNSAATDDVGWISPDGCRLYLSSNRGTMRGYEIYMAKR